jgi:hypothetical protein
MGFDWTWEFLILFVFAAIGFFYVMNTIYGRIQKKREKEYDLERKISKQLDIRLSDLYFCVSKPVLKQMKGAFLNNDFEALERFWDIAAKEVRDRFLHKNS